MSQDYERQPRTTKEYGKARDDYDVYAYVQLEVVQEEKKTAAAPETPPEEEGNTLDILELFFFLLAKAKWIIAASLLGAILGAAYAQYSFVPIYQATSKLYIMSQDNVALSLSDLQVGSLLTLDYQEVFKTWEVHEMVRSELDLDYSYAALQSMLTISNPEETRLLYITVRSTDPQLSTDLANAYAKAAKTFILQTMDAREPNVFSIALVPSGSVTASKSSTVMMGFLMGTALSGGLLVLRFMLDDRPHSPEEIMKFTGLPTLAVIPKVEKEKKNRKREDEHAVS